jgi:voltage-gated potassium channel
VAKRKPEARPDRARRFTPLRRAVKLPVWGDASLRLGAALFLVAIVVLIHWFDRDGLVDHADGHISFLDVVYFTMISITTTGFGDIAPVSNQSRLVEAVIVTPIRVVVLFIFVGAAYSLVIKRGWEKWRMARIQKQLSDHIVVLGFGVSGSEAVAELIARGTDPHDIVVMETDPERLAVAEEMGCNVIEADATRDENQMAVRIDKAPHGAGLGRARRRLDPDRADRAPPRPDGADQRGHPRRGQRAARAQAGPTT